MLRGIDDSCGNDIWGGGGYRGYRYAQPTAKHGLSPMGIDRISALHVLRATFQSPLQLRGGLRGDLQCIIMDCPYRYTVGIGVFSMHY